MNTRIIHLSWIESQRLSEASNIYWMTKCNYKQCTLYQKDFLAESAKAIFEASTLQSLKQFYNDPNEHILIIKSTPVGVNLPPTPCQSGYERMVLVPQSVFNHLIFLAVGELNPISYPYENRGRLIRHVVPAKTSSSQKSSHGSKCAFGLHVDNPHCVITG
ncbi:MAG: hypothetical protein MJK04_30625, partial [Psychrosphaera sp.]|nr:hypothetical protein [Psychrosphaera sp.]